MWLDSSSVDGDADDDGDDDGDEREGGSIPSCIKCQLNQQVPTSFISGVVMMIKNIWWWNDDVDTYIINIHMSKEKC